MTFSDTSMMETVVADASRELVKVVGKHLDWSDKQRRILTANGKADRFYCNDRGCPFTETELSHYYLLQSLNGVQNAASAREIYRKWKGEDASNKSPIVGAWKRPLFYGGWEHSTDVDEHVFNLQTNTLFVDLRIPCTRDFLFAESAARSLNDMNAEQLAYYARQHIFAGYARLDTHDALGTSQSMPFDHCCTRHHCIDWNFVGIGRSRPNKWWIETTDDDEDDNVWKEWAYATDDRGQQYYCERWERLEQDRSPILALRKVSGRDGIIIVLGDHFNYCLDREVTGLQIKKNSATAGSLVNLVDAAIKQGDLATARAWLGVQGGHGRISRGWQLDHCIEFWKESSPLWSKIDVAVHGESIDDCTIIWNGEAWEIFECTLSTVNEVRDLLYTNLTR